MAELADAPDLGSGVLDVQVQPLSPAPNKNESYDTIGIATFVLFFLTKMPVAQGFSAIGHKRIISLCRSRHYF